VVHVSLWLLTLVDPAPFDRNCHKSIPVYLNPTRDAADGIIGPVVDHRFLDEQPTCATRIAKNLLVISPTPDQRSSRLWR
jgi:arginine/lysine/ornithine decarboxylase